MELDFSLRRHAPFSRHEFDSSPFEQFGIKMTQNIVKKNIFMALPLFIGQCICDT